MMTEQTHSGGRRFVIHETTLERALENQRRIDAVLARHSLNTDVNGGYCRAHLDWIKWPCWEVQTLAPEVTDVIAPARTPSSDG